MFLLFPAACTNMQNVNFVSVPTYATTGHLIIHYCFCFFKRGLTSPDTCKLLSNVFWIAGICGTF